MKGKLIEVLGLDADATDEQVISAVNYLVRISNSPGAKQEKAVREKVAAGLSREDAIQVLKDQAVDDDIREEREAQEAETAAVAKRQAEKAKSSPPVDTGKKPETA